MASAISESAWPSVAVKYLFGADAVFAEDDIGRMISTAAAGRRGQVRMKAEESAAGIPYVALRAKFGRPKALYGKRITGPPSGSERPDTAYPQAPESQGHFGRLEGREYQRTPRPSTGGCRIRSGSASTPHTE